MLERLANRDAWWAILLGELTREEDPHPKSGVWIYVMLAAVGRESECTGIQC
jgi:hypothetical protein